MPSNFERWLSITEGLTSPNSYIHWGYHYLISACLQRRVWCGPRHMPIFPNMYVILVGEAGLGKGIVIKPIAELLKYHKLQDQSVSKQQLSKALTDADKTLMEEVKRQDYMRAKSHEDEMENKNGAKFRTFEKPDLFPVAPDDTTYESLVQVTAKALRRINFDSTHPETGQPCMGIYTHSSLAFCLEELSSLMKKHTENVVRYLLVTYDCGDYDRDTKHQGKDRVKKCCVNILAGTTPEYMQDIFNSRIIDEGLSSRAFFIYESQDREASLFIPELTPEQEQYKKDLLGHIKDLSELYGPVTVDKDTQDMLELWWKSSQSVRPNTSVKLNPYYRRKKVHVFKLAMSRHFSESLERHIKRETFEEVFEILKRVELKMHYALGLDNNNPLARVATGVYKFIATHGEKTKKEITAEFWEAVPNGNQSIEDILQHLMAMGKVILVPRENPITKECIYTYGVITQDRSGVNVP